MSENRPTNDETTSKPSFEEILRRLEETVQSLEAGGLALEETIRQFEEGMRLSRMCNEILANAELHITRIQTGHIEQKQPSSETEVPEEGSTC